MRRRVVITGLGAITPVGVGVGKSWQALCAGRSGIARITKFDATGYRTQVAGEVNDFRAEDFLDAKMVRRTDRYIHFALAAAQMAMEDAGFKVTPENEKRVGVIVGTTSGGISTYEKNHESLLRGARNEVSPFFIPAFLLCMAAAQITMRFGAKGPSFGPSTACAASTHAIGDAFWLIQRGAVDAVITGGS